MENSLAADSIVYIHSEDILITDLQSALVLMMTVNMKKTAAELY